MSDVLIIEHDAAFAAQLVRQMEAIGCASTCCSSLRQGLAYAQANSLNLVVLSERMPDGDSLDALESICRTPSRPADRPRSRSGSSTCTGRTPSG